MASPRVRVRNPNATKEQDAAADWLKKLFSAMTPEERHAAIVDAVPEWRDLPGKVRLVREKGAKR